jgi:UDP-N-acetylglucosamine 2-epimerase
LRSFDEHNPFPEEKNRVLIGQMAHWHFAPTIRARNNLRSEGIADNSIFVVGNTIVQAAKLGADLSEAQRKKKVNTVPDLVDKLSEKSKNMRMVLVTSHRRENHHEGLRSIAKSVLELLKTHKDMLVVWPTHPNPKVMSIVHEEMGQVEGEMAERLFLTKPLSYPVLLWILKHSWVVLTDSGGIQEEAVSLNTPVLVLRKNTERPEVIEVGAGALVGTSTDRILSAVAQLTENREQYDSMKNVTNPFGDMRVAGTICNILLGKDSVSKNPNNPPLLQESSHV